MTATYRIKNKQKNKRKNPINSITCRTDTAGGTDPGLTAALQRLIHNTKHLNLNLMYLCCLLGYKLSSSCLSNAFAIFSLYLGGSHYIVVCSRCCAAYLFGFHRNPLTRSDSCHSDLLFLIIGHIKYKDCWPRFV